MKIGLVVAVLMLFPVMAMAVVTLPTNVNTNTNVVSPSQSQTQIQAQSVTGNTNDVSYQDQKDPTIYGFSSAPMVNTPTQQIAFDRMVANTSASLFDMTEWQYKNIWNDVKAEGFVDVCELFQLPSKEHAKNSQINIYKSKEEAKKIGNIKILGIGVLNATESGVYTLRMEKYLLSKAKSMNANGIVVVSKHLSIETKQGTFGIGGGFSGTMLERLGSFALNIPIGLSYATSIGMGVPKPFISYMILAVEPNITFEP